MDDLDGQLRIVSKKEYEAFIKSYPHTLEKDFCTMTESTQYFDSRIDGGMWPKAVVAQCRYAQYPDEENVYAIHNTALPAQGEGR